MSEILSPSENFILETTLDGSPTLRLKKSADPASEKPPESMHHSAGAAAETQYIYGTALQKAFEGFARNAQTAPSEMSTFYPTKTEMHVLVVGLGLGYIEILAAGVSQNFPHLRLKISSYEIDLELKQNFKKWASGAEDFSIYDEVCRCLGYAPEKIKTILQTVDFQIYAGLNSDTIFSSHAQVICFDAFSRKTSGGLWSEQFLQNFLQHASAQDCVFTTYACTGDLKRALVSQDFTFIKRPGFTQKRDSTLALRGIFA